MWHELANHGRTAGEVLAATAALLGTLFGFSRYIVKQVEKRLKKARDLAVDMQAIMEMAGKQIAATVAPLDPARYYTFDYRTPDGNTLRLPLVPGREMKMVPPHMNMSFHSHTVERTKYFLSITGRTELDLHAHSYDEELEVLRGEVTCRRTGRIFCSGETWRIEKGEVHSAYFEQDTVVLGAFLPGLPTAQNSPVDLRGIGMVFKFPPELDDTPVEA